MFKKFACAAVVLGLTAGIALADTVRGIITKASDSEITVMVRKKGEKKGEKKTFKVSKATKISMKKGKDDDAEKSSLADLKKAIAAGKRFKGVFASIEVDDDKATAITYMARRERKKPKKDD
jgi:hypothetical protein